MSDLLLRRSAIISDCELFRYELRRLWDERLPPFVIGMLNPSYADGEIDDATTTRNIRRAAANRCGSLIQWNLGAGRATAPSDWMAMVDPIGPDNDIHIRRILTECRERGGIAVAAWGSHGSFANRDRVALRIAAESGVVFQCLGLTREGQPRHPGRLAHAEPLIAWHT